MSVFIENPQTGKRTAAFQLHISSNIEKAEALLRSMPGGAETALDKAILSARRAHSKLAKEAIVKEYNITETNLTKKDGGKSRIVPKYRKMMSVGGHGFIHEILYSGHVIPLAEFHRNPQDRRDGQRSRPIWKTTWKGHSPDLYHFRSSKSPNIHVEKEGKASKIRRAFVAKVHAGADAIHVGIFERTEERASAAAVNTVNGKILAINGDSTIAQKYGPSVEHMVSNERVREAVDAEMNRRVEQKLNEAIGKILEGKISV